MEKAAWIWYPGDYEAYHATALHMRRQQYGADYPAMWHLPLPYPEVQFSKEYDADEDFTVTVRHNGIGFVRVDEGKTCSLDQPMHCPRGHHTLKIRISYAGHLPSIFIDSDVIKTNESFTVSIGGNERLRPVSAACTPAYGAEGNVEKFPFAEIDIAPVSSETVAGGVLYDFGKETFGPVRVTGTEGKVGIFYGESREEALAGEHDCCVWEYTDKDTEMVPRAFRFIHVRGTAAIAAREEYLDIPERGSFRTNDPKVEEIRRVCARTFHLCSREFFLDGIKRDRWVWSGDARQALLIANYLFADREICKRTIRSLLPKDVMYEHTNTINDYSLYMIISLWEYYESFGDLDFVKEVWPRIEVLYAFVQSRLDAETGFMVERSGDWIFIDWAEMDKEGPIAAEQILLWEAENAMARLCRLLALPDGVYVERAARLRERIFSFYYDREKGAFVDSYVSGKRNISRHPHIFAILFDFVDKDMAKEMFHRVLKNDAVKPIITPYFKLYELAALCKMGDLPFAQNMLSSYWGKMLEMGATSMWEQFDPAVPIPDCYEMYGERFGKSLCHAWSAGPIYFLGRYCLGVAITKPGYEEYTVTPTKGIYNTFEGTVPTEKGDIYVAYKDGTVIVRSEVPCGTLFVEGRAYEIPVGEELRVKGEI